MFDVDGAKGLMLVEIAEGVSLEDIRAATGCQFEVHTQREINLSGTCERIAFESLFMES